MEAPLGLPKTTEFRQGVNVKVNSGKSFTDFAASNPKKSQYAEKGQDLTPNKEQFLERAKTKEDSSP